LSVLQYYIEAVRPNGRGASKESKMSKRWKMSKGKSRHQFRRGAGSKHKNFAAAPMRGGIRL